MAYSVHSSDTELVKGCQKHNRLAQKYLYQKYFGKVLGIAMRYAGNREEAIDVLNQSFLKVFQNIKTYESQGKLQAWIASIVFRTSIDYVRQQAKYKQVMNFNLEVEMTTSNEAIDNLEVADLYKLIQKLAPATRSVFSLYVVEGYKHREIAELLNISVGTSKWHLATARKQLQELLRSHPDNREDVRRVKRIRS